MVKESEKRMENKEKEERFAALLDEYGGMIRKICYMYASDGDHFKDLCQEVVLNLWRGFDGYRGMGKLSSWIYRVGINTCISFYRRYGRNAGHVSLEELCGVAEEESGRALRLEEMYRLISRLDGFERALILLWLDEHTYEQIAEITGLPRNTVATRLRRIREKLSERAER